MLSELCGDAGRYKVIGHASVPFMYAGMDEMEKLAFGIQGFVCLARDFNLRNNVLDFAHIAVQMIVFAGFDMKRARCDERADIAAVEVFPEIRHKVAGAVVREKEKGFLETVEPAADDGNGYALVACR